MSICCTFCSAEDAKFKCSRCNTARYCNRGCQSQDWESHKTICFVPNKAGSGDKTSAPKARGNVGVGEKMNDSPRNGIRMQCEEFFLGLKITPGITNIKGHKTFQDWLDHCKRFEASSDPDRLLDSTDPDIIKTTLSNIECFFQVFNVTGKNKETIPSKAIHINYKNCLQVFGADSDETLRAITNYAKYFIAINNYKEAEIWLRKCVKKCINVQGPNHEGTLAALTLLGETYAAQDKSAKAESIYKKIINIRKLVNGVDNIATLAVLGTLANLYVYRENFVEAETAYGELYEARKVHLQDDPETLGIQYQLGVAKYKNGKINESEIIHLQVIDKLNNLFGPANPELIEVTMSLAGVYYNEKKYSKAEPLFRKVVAYKEKEFGVNHPDVRLLANALKRCQSLMRGGSP